MSASKSQETVRCYDCDALLPSNADKFPRDPCPQCGSISRKIAAAISERETVREKIGLKQKRSGFRRAIYEEKSGDDFWRIKGKWMKVIQIVDRLNNRYRKKIVDPRTGETVRDTDEPLTEHQGYGSAKEKAK